ncbi:diguanylate cyclase [Acetobacterium paludosum]|uniref:Diguanylate cyclase n=1 Tax=Acetobacterium paludosum TaxID=52693 RepID=A0A923HWS1_9FIRM|nr:diguanylate cyclase [Acetobacterium paludosum]
MRTKSGEICFCKQFNDSYGHLKGDQVLLALAGLMKKRYKKNRLWPDLAERSFQLFAWEVKQIIFTTLWKIFE